MSNDGNYLLLSVFKGCAHEHKLYYANLKDLHTEKKLNFIKLVDNFDSKYEYVTNFGPLFYFINNLKTPKN